MLKKIGLGVAAIIAGILLFAATKPATFSVERGAVIKAPPATVHAMLNDFHAWGAWSPWEKLDPAMKRTYGGAASGVGATYAWEGNKEVGSGRMEITASAPASSVTLTLDFLSPFEAHNVTEFTLTPAADSTRVRWRMSGPNTYMSKLMSVFTSMDAMVGPDFEKGLATMKGVAEKSAAEAAASAPPPAPAAAPGATATSAKAAVRK